MKPPDTKAIRARADAATAGEWRVSSTGYSVKSSSDDMPIVASNPWGSGMSTTKQIEPWLDNAEFIAAARTDVPALCDRVEALEAALRRVDAEADHAGDCLVTQGYGTCSCYIEAVGAALKGEAP